MEPWGVLAFQNDTALDWIWELEDEDDTFVLSDAFAAVIEAESEADLDIQTAEEALAAAEVVAALLDRPLAELPSEVNIYLSKVRKKQPSSELVEMATEAVERILESSELRDRWVATESADQWMHAMGDLQYRLQRRM